ncbi:Polysaccharide biosynthesis domain [Dillenia turbinata]|uniref:Polysaccharide biosynthesis domain n=1 Tax=Dillenia turbinata TaxID=194707 RepID=A0AAN8Z109_9MAGN
MPTEVSSCQPFVTTVTRFLPPISPKSQLTISLNHKYCRGKKKMMINKKKLIPIVVFILASLSIFRFLKTTTSISSTRFSTLPATLLDTCNSSSPTCRKVHSAATANRSSSRSASSTNSSILTAKEMKLLLDLISRRSPCNVLVFGLEPQYLQLSKINAGGITIFLEDDPNKISTISSNSNNTRIYKVEHQIPAREAYEQLKNARLDAACMPTVELEFSTCKLALKKLPREVYEHKWDVVVVDGPSSDNPEAPGRMAAIYTASIIARAGNITDVVVHDVNRSIEKWYSWEFLCYENLVSSKGKLWDFRIVGKQNSTKFCPIKQL